MPMMKSSPQPPQPSPPSSLIISAKEEHGEEKEEEQQMTQKLNNKNHNHYHQQNKSSKSCSPPPPPAVKQLPLAGESLPEISFTVIGKVVYCCQLSPSMSLFTLQLLFLNEDKKEELGDNNYIVQNNNNSSSSNIGGTTNDEKKIVTSSSSSSSILDVILKRKDGWSQETMETIHQQFERILVLQEKKQEKEEKEKDDTTVIIQAVGYLERMRPKYDNDWGAPLCMHPQTIEIVTTTTPTTSGSSSNGSNNIKNCNDDENDTKSVVIYRAHPISPAPQVPPPAPTEAAAAEVEFTTTTTTKLGQQEPNGPTLQKMEEETTTISSSQNNKYSSKNNTNNSNNSTKNSKKYRGANDSTRFGRFVDFVLEEFGGYEHLAVEGNGPVLDVAGGAGGLAFELTIRHEIPTIVVDTRRVKFEGKQKRHLQFRRECFRRLEDAAKKYPGGVNSPVAINLQNRFQIPQELQQFVTLLDSSYVLGEEEDDDAVCMTSFKLNDNNQQQQHQQQELRDILRNRKCSILLGLHPDQATDHIVDIGLALGIPFAVIPCCVFPNLLQQRRLKPTKTSTTTGSSADGGHQQEVGRPVRTYDDLCQFLREKHPTIQEKVLPFRGRNRVFYWHPPTTSTSVTTLTSSSSSSSSPEEVPRK